MNAAGSRDTDAGLGLATPPPLSRIRIGQDVAEYDDLLRDCFVRTAAYHTLVSDDADVVLGPKGSGKSALARTLCDPDYAESMLTDILVLPAFNLQGSVLFRRLSESNLSQANPEKYYRDVFFIFMAALIANHLLESFQGLTEAGTIQNHLQRLGLLIQAPTAKSVWATILSRIRPTVQIASTESGAVLFTGSMSVDDPRDHEADLVSVDDGVELLLDTVSACLSGRNLRAWVVFDRLDEAFLESPDIEIHALRGLLRAHLDFTEYGPTLRSKLFLRQDAFEKITSHARFVNLSHVRATRIVWSRPGICQMLALRIADTKEVRSALRSCENSRVPENYCAKLLPLVDGLNGLNWLMLVTVDGSRELNPRNVLALFRASVAEELHQFSGIERNAVKVSSKALGVGLRQLSLRRLEDTIVAEDHSIKPFVDRLRGDRFEFSTADLIATLGALPADADSVLDRLVSTGLLRRDMSQDERDYKYSIPPLFRPALFRADLTNFERRLQLGNGIEVPPQQSGETASAGYPITTPTRPVPGPGVQTAPSDDTEGKSPPDSRPKRQRTRKGADQTWASAPVRVGSVLDPRARDESSNMSVSEGEQPQPGSGSRSGSPAYHARRAEKWRQGQEISLAISSARRMAENGLPSWGFDILHPALSTHVGAACAAADLAFQTRDRQSMLAAFDTLLQHLFSRDADIPAPLGRLIALSTESGIHNDRFVSLCEMVTASTLQGVAIAISRIMGHAQTEEHLCWCRFRDLANQLPDENLVKSNWPILAASRLLAWVRSAKERLREEWNTGTLAETVFVDLDDSLVNRLLEYVTHYCESPDTLVPRLLPYQVISQVAVIECAGRELSAGSRQQVVSAITRELASAESEYVARFAEWAGYSALVRDVALPDQQRIPASPFGEPGGQVDDTYIALVADAVDNLLRIRTDKGLHTFLSDVGIALRGEIEGFTAQKAGFGKLSALIQHIQAIRGSFTLEREGTAILLISNAAPASGTPTTAGR
jgi:hypothetical protein